MGRFCPSTRILVGWNFRKGQVAALRAKHPLISLDLMARTSSGTRQGLMSGELDVGVLLGRPLETAFTYYELMIVPYRVAGPIAWKDQIDAADWKKLANLPWLIPSASSAYSAMLAQLFGDKGLELNVVVRFDNSAVGRTALRAGAGMMLLREDNAAQGQKEGYLAVSPIARAEIPLSIAHQSGRKNDPLICALLEAAKAIWTEMKLTDAQKTA
jgi:DNA-binding transcriptional LysR family regulator